MFAVSSAGIALSAVGVTGASAPGAAPRAVPVSSARASHVPANPGTQLWAKRCSGPADSNNQATSVTVSPTQNGVFVTGENTRNGGLTNAYATVAYSG